MYSLIFFRFDVTRWWNAASSFSTISSPAHGEKLHLLPRCEQGHREAQRVIWTPFGVEKGGEIGELLPHGGPDARPEFSLEIWRISLSVFCRQRTSRATRQRVSVQGLFPRGRWPAEGTSWGCKQVASSALENPLFSGFSKGFVTLKLVGRFSRLRRGFRYRMGIPRGTREVLKG